jgi:hypothetical protein
MKKILLFLVCFTFLSITPSHADFFGSLLEKIEPLTKAVDSPATSSSPLNLGSTEAIVSGLKEALSVGIEKAVQTVSQLNGYSNNPDIKIPLPDTLNQASQMREKVGMGQLINNFELSMNQAAEKAAPKATSIFLDAIKNISIEDGKKILDGGETAATEFLKSKTFTQLYEEFKPAISSSISEVNVTGYYKDIANQISSIPFVTMPALDLDDYVTKNSLDGLFEMVGDEEKKIRKDPAARVTDLLQQVFK